MTSKILNWQFKAFWMCHFGTQESFWSKLKWHLQIRQYIHVFQSQKEKFSLGLWFFAMKWQGDSWGNLKQHPNYWSTIHSFGMVYFHCNKTRGNLEMAHTTLIVLFHEHIWLLKWTENYKKFKCGKSLEFMYCLTPMLGGGILYIP